MVIKMWLAITALLLVTCHCNEPPSPKLLTGEEPTPSTPLRTGPPSLITPLRTGPPSPSTPLRTEPPSPSTPLRTGPPSPIIPVAGEPMVPIIPLRTGPPSPTTPLINGPPTPNTPLRSAAPEAVEYLGAHNEARANVGVGPLKWSDALAKSASLTARIQRDKHNCAFADLANSRYGVNQLWSGGVAVAARAAVESWVEEKKFYSYGNNSCEGDHHCGVYTQVVWRKSTELGCAQAACVKGKSTLTVCLYDPPGNVVGEKPY